MEAPAITRRRKPFLAPIFLGLLFAVAMVAVVVAFLNYAGSGASIAVVLRHAETPGTIADPPLSEAGELRAQNLARMFGETSAVGHVTAIFATEFRRTQQTATPLAARLGIPVTVVRSDDIDKLVKTLSHRDNQGAAVVVAHSNTVPRIVSGLAKVSIPAIGDTTYDQIYIVTIPRFGKASVVSLKY